MYSYRCISLCSSSCPSLNDEVLFQVYLHAEESWAETALATYWWIKPVPWWVNLARKWRGRPHRLVVEEHIGGGARKTKGKADMIDNDQQGVLWIRGSFNCTKTGKEATNQYFKVGVVCNLNRGIYLLNICVCVGGILQ